MGDASGLPSKKKLLALTRQLHYVNGKIFATAAYTLIIIFRDLPEYYEEPRCYL